MKWVEAGRVRKRGKRSRGKKAPEVGEGATNIRREKKYCGNERQLNPIGLKKSEAGTWSIKGNSSVPGANHKPGKKKKKKGIK